MGNILKDLSSYSSHSSSSTGSSLTARCTGAGTMIDSAAGQSVLHPAIGEARAQRIVLHRLLAALQLPDEDGAVVPTTATLRARKAAQSRWAGQRGARRGTA